MEALMMAAIGLASVNSVLLATLIYIYSRIFLRTRATYSIGLVVFAGLLLLRNLLTAFAYGTMSPLFGVEALPFLAAMGGAELAGLLVLLKITV